MAAAATVCEEGRAREAKADLRSMLVLDTMSPAQAAARLAPLLAPAVSRPLSVGELACLVSRFRGGDGTIKSMPRSATLQVGALFAALDTDGSSGLDAAELAVGITVLASGSHADKLVAATLLCEAVRTVSGGLIDQADLPVTLLRLATRLPDSVVLSPETVRTVADAALRTQAALSPALTRDCLRFVAEHGGPDGAPGAADGVDLCRAARQLLASSDPVPRPGDVGWEVAAACATVAASGTHAEFDAWLDDNDEQPTVAAFARFHATEASSTELQGLGSAAGAASSAANPGALAAALDAHTGPGRTPAADEDADSTGTANTDTAPELPSGFTPGETTASLQGSASRHAASFSPGMPAIVGVGPAHARGGSTGLIGRAADFGPGAFPAASAGRAQSLPLAEAGTLFAGEGAHRPVSQAAGSGPPGARATPPQLRRNVTRTGGVPDAADASATAAAAGAATAAAPPLHHLHHPGQSNAATVGSNAASPWSTRAATSSEGTPLLQRQLTGGSDREPVAPTGSLLADAGSVAPAAPALCRQHTEDFQGEAAGQASMAGLFPDQAVGPDAAPVPGGFSGAPALMRQPTEEFHQELPSQARQGMAAAGAGSAAHGSAEPLPVLARQVTLTGAPPTAPALSPAHGGAPSSSNPLPSAPPYPVPSAPPSAIASSGRHASDGSGSAFGMPAVDPATVGLGSKEWEAAPDTGAADLRGGEQR
uniref:EF-hand domain-containing protein n=1 Tax=Cafeteria roenbergensis TaxID=33653 RepID=A0A7S0P9L5_CAFRO